MKSRKQILSFLLALVFIITLVPLSAFAADDLETPAPEAQAAFAPDAPAEHAPDAPAEPAADQAEDPGEIGEEAEDSEPVLYGEVDGTLDADAEPAQEQEGESEDGDPSDSGEAALNPVRVLFLAEDKAALIGLTVADADGNSIEPLYDEEAGEYLYGSYLLVPGTYFYAFHDDGGNYADLEAQSFIVAPGSEALAIELSLREIEAAPVSVVFTCAEEVALSGLQLYDNVDAPVSPVVNEDTGEAVYGSYLLLPSDYSYRLHDESGQFKDLVDTLYVGGDQDIRIELVPSPVPKGMCFSGSFVNPIYENVIAESDLPEVAVSPEESLERLQEAVSPSLAANGQSNRKFMAANRIPIFDNIEDAGDALKKELLLRRETVTLRLITDLEPDEENWSLLSYIIYSEAIRHNGTPTEGDYLRYEYGGVSYTGSIVPSDYDGIYYYEFVYAPLYFTTLEQENELSAKVSAILGSLDLNNRGDYDKVKAIYDYICSHVSYDNANLNNSSYNLKYTAYAALVNGTAVCQGFSVALYRLCLAAGIDARVVTSADILHAWNIALIDGTYYYYLDSTWDAGVAPEDYQHFLKGTKNWAKTHPAGDEFGPLKAINGFESYQLTEEDYVPPAAVIRKASVVFEGMIRIKYYLEYTQSLLSQRGACVVFYQGGEEVTRVPLNAVADQNGFYTQYFNVIPKLLSEDVTLRIFDAFGRPVPMHSQSGKDYTEGFPYSAMTYAAQIQQNSNNGYMRALARALEDYGTAAQIYFKYGDYSALNISSAVQNVSSADLDPYAIRTDGEKPAGITKAQISVVFEADNSLRIYFTYSEGHDPGDYSYAIDGSPAQILRRGDGAYYITLQNVAAQDLEIPHTFSVSDGTDTYTITTSVLGYAKLAIDNGLSVSDLGRALYLYNRAADAYFMNK